MNHSSVFPIFPLCQLPLLSQNSQITCEGIRTTFRIIFLPFLHDWKQTSARLLRGFFVILPTTSPTPTLLSLPLTAQLEHPVYATEQTPSLKGPPSHFRPTQCPSAHHGLTLYVCSLKENSGALYHIFAISEFIPLNKLVLAVKFVFHLLFSCPSLQYALSV